MRLVMLTKGGAETGYAVSPEGFEADAAPDGDGKTWHAAGYKLAYYEDTREPYTAPRHAPRVAPAPVEKAKE